MMAEDTCKVPSNNIWACDGLQVEEEQYWQCKAVELKMNEGTRVKAASAKWTAVLSTITGVAAITAILTSYDQLRSLDRTWQIGIAAALVLALLLILFAIEKAFRAEAGGLTQFAGTARETCNYVSTGPTADVVQVRKSRYAAFTALAVLVAAILALGFAPTEAKNFVAVPESGSALCGTLKTQQDGSVALIAAQKDASPLPILSKTTLVEVPSCDTV
jgi:hypothetical protein